QFIKKEKNVKLGLRKLNQVCYSAIGNRVKLAEKVMQEVQLLALANPNDTLAAAAKYCHEKWHGLKLAEEPLMKQNSKVTLLNLGDTNTAYFHRSVKIRQARNQIVHLEREDGTLATRVGDMTKIVVDFYSKLLGEVDTNVFDIPISELESLLINRLTKDLAEKLCREVIEEEIKQAMFAIPGSKCSDEAINFSF
ncbi:hypothetical protein LINPERPRIM_LOCUS20615, partial [Linum perenne]